MERKILGIHHVTAIVGNPQQNVDFYTGVLGLRFVKRTVNFDDPDTYHLYYAVFPFNLLPRAWRYSFRDCNISARIHT